MISQYTGSYSVPSSDIQALVNARVAPLDRYIIMRTGEYEYTALIQKGVTKEVTQLVISRSTGGSSHPWTVSESLGEFDYTVSCPYYVVSNVGLGRQLDLLCWRGITAWSLAIIASVLCLWILFKGVLFGWRRR